MKTHGDDQKRTAPAKMRLLNLSIIIGFAVPLLILSILALTGAYEKILGNTSPILALLIAGIAGIALIYRIASALMFRRR
ncbi:MAG TPA: hypothetical protein PKY19_05165 [Oscillospiraceae bacterium]|nr:hypothetical protein [Oscillospiraceae bacterium]